MTPIHIARMLAIFIATELVLPPPVARAAAGDPAILEIQVMEGEGSSYITGSRATRGVTIMVADETGRPVEGAKVSFSLPPDGPSGVFLSGSRTEIATTRADGRAAAWGMQWNRSPGPLEIRITAVKGSARAGTTAAQYLTAAAAGRAPPRGNAATAPVANTSQGPPGGLRSGGHKWIWVTLAMAGAAVAGVGFAGRQSAGTAIAATSTLQIGTPSIILGRQ